MRELPKTPSLKSVGDIKPLIGRQPPRNRADNPAGRSGTPALPARYGTDGSVVKREFYASGGVRPWVKIGGRAQRAGRGEAEPATAGAGLV
jgi:hypothetical protein